jgi:hypothetical protein
MLTSTKVVRCRTAGEELQVVITGAFSTVPSPQVSVAEWGFGVRRLVAFV